MKAQKGYILLAIIGLLFVVPIPVAVLIIVIMVAAGLRKYDHADD